MNIRSTCLLYMGATGIPVRMHEYLGGDGNPPTNTLPLKSSTLPMHRYLEDNCKSLHGRSNILSIRSIVLIILIHNHLYKSIEESDQHHHGRASSPHQRQGHSRQGPPPPHRACRAPPPPLTGYRARGEEESKPEILENKNQAQSCPIDSPAPLPQACTPGPLCTALTPPGCSGSPGLPAGTSLSPARPCVGRTANLPEKIKIYMKSCSPLT